MARVTSPSQLRMPAEWEQHEATWIAWPHEETDWPGKFAPVKWVYGSIVHHLSRVERVRVLVRNRADRAEAREVFEKSGARMDRVDFYLYRTNRSWCRDYCPIWVRDARGESLVTDWKFNAWAKYRNWRLDNAAPAFIAKKLGLKRIEPGMVLEGGSIDVNGQGLLLTTEECLLSPVQARNPDLSREDLEAMFAQYLGIDRVIWLNRGIAGDDTHGHVDDLARFVDPGTIVTVVERNRNDENHEPLAENWRLLKRTGLRIVALPMPAPVWFDGQRLPASYANFYIANGIVLVPTFNDPNDRVALNTLQRLFPDRKVIGIHCLDLVLGLGTLHCMTQQEPAAISQP
ncbi:MAG: agmatine deiminase family protein [Bryobacteraceae bacterium]